METPPAFLYMFKDRDFREVEVHVLKGTINNYYKIPYWWNFMTIIDDLDPHGNNDDMVGVESIIISDSQKNWTKAVYNLNGVKVSDSTEGLALGLYIIRQGNTTVTVFIP